LAEAIEVSTLVYSFELNTFMNLFISSGVSHQFEIGNPKYIVGKSGTELVHEVVDRVYGPSKVVASSSYYSNPGPEYWAGWVLAYYQWVTGSPFKEIQKIMTLQEIYDHYKPYHEMDEEQIVELINKKAQDSNININGARRLQAYRKRWGLSQSQLAREANVNLRTLQQYEIGAKDLGKASANTILSLCEVLNCKPKDLIIPPACKS
jgi:DNA-binding XRE family transcriptional regulator